MDYQNIKNEVKYKTSRSGGAGGQNVNKVETKVIILWDFENSSLLSNDEKNLIRSKLQSKIQSDGYLQLESSETRSQLANKEHALSKLVNKVVNALKLDKNRIATKIPRSKILARLDRKAKLSKKKTDRRWRMD